MSEIEEILSQVPMDQVAAVLGVDRSEAEEVTRTAIPALLGGMQANAADPDGAASLMNAVEQHDTTALGADLDQIDTQDGERIVHNVFGEQTPDVMARLGGATPGEGSSLIQKLLPIIAPIVMAYLAKKLQGATGGGTAAATDDPIGGLGGMLGGAGGAGAGGLGDVLGGAPEVPPGGGATGSGGSAQGGGSATSSARSWAVPAGRRPSPGRPPARAGSATCWAASSAVSSAAASASQRAPVRACRRARDRILLRAIWSAQSATADQAFRFQPEAVRSFDAGNGAKLGTASGWKRKAVRG